MAKRGRKPMAKTYIQSKFSEILSRVEVGRTIREAFSEFNIDSASFYTHITKEQKQLLSIAKTSNAKYSCRGHNHYHLDNLTTSELFNYGLIDQF